MLTEKENYLRVLRGEWPEWIPRMGFASPGRPPTSAFFMPSYSSMLGGGPVLDSAGNAIGYKDMWGVEYVSTKETSNASLPVPDKFILEDITKWRDIVKIPEVPDVDWEAMAKKDLENVDRENSAVSGGQSGYFLPLMNMMGFSNGLMAMYEEPDEVLALFDAMHEFYEAINKKIFYYYKPDTTGIGDDIATAGNLFVSPEIYRSLVKPYHAADAKLGLENDMPVSLHCCGKCDEIVEDWVEMGVTAWNPAQVMNDLLSIKAKYGRGLALTGCFDSHGPANWPHAPEEAVRQAVRDCIDTYAPGGGFIFWGSTYGDLEDPDTENKARWITEEYDSYGRTFYERNGYV